MGVYASMKCCCTVSQNKTCPPMKKLLFLILLIAPKVHAQEPTGMLRVLNYNNNLQNSIQEHYTYSNELLIEVKRENWNLNTAEWDAHDIETYTYSDDGLLEEILIQEYDMYLEEYVDEQLSIFSYHQDGRLKTEIKYVVTDTGNVPYLLDTFIYNADNLLIEHLILGYFTTTADWNNYKRNKYTYDQDGLMLSKEYQTWNSADGVWMNEDQFHFTHFANGNIKSKLWKIWNSLDGVWFDLRIEEMEYDANGNLGLATTFSLTSGTEELHSRIEYQRNGNGFLLNEIYSLYEEVEDDWRALEYCLFFYDESLSIQQEARMFDLTVFPNPTQSRLTVQCSNPTLQVQTVSLLNLAGKTITSKTPSQGRGTIILHVSHLPRGMYLLQLEDKSGQLLVNQVVLN